MMTSGCACRTTSSNRRRMRKYFGRLPRTPNSVATLLTERLFLYLNSNVGSCTMGSFIADSNQAGIGRCRLTPSVTATTWCPAASAISLTAMAWVMCPRPSPSTQNIIFMEMDEFDLAVEIFNQSGAAFNPIPAVQVFDAVNHLHFGAVNVAADDALRLLLAGHRSEGAFVFGDKFDGGLGLEFEKRGQRPITKSERATQPVEIQIEVENPVVKMRT